MVKLHVKKGDESQFLFETTTDTDVEFLTNELVTIYNGRLKVHRICDEMSELGKVGLSLPPNMQGLTDEQIVELKLVDEWGEKCIPSGGFVENKDPLGKRNGKAPTEKMKEVLDKTVAEAKELINKKLVQNDIFLTRDKIQEALNILSGACTIVYPMGLPPHEPIKAELNNEEDLSGTQAALEVLDLDGASVWFSGKEMQRGKKLSDYIGKNEKTKVIVKLTKKGSGAPAREPVVSEQEQKQMMAYYYKKQEEWKKLEKDGDTADGNHYLNSEWADSNNLKKQFHGLSDIKWGPR